MIVNPIFITIFASIITVKAIIMDVYSLTDSAILKLMGEHMRRDRLGQNISQRALAKSAGVALSSVVNIENGKSISLLTLIPLLRALNSLDLLAAFTKEPEISPIEFAKLMDGKKEKKRASAPKKNTEITESEW